MKLKDIKGLLPKLLTTAYPCDNYQRGWEKGIQTTLTKIAEKEIEIDVEKINQSLNIHLATNYTEKYQGLSMDWCAICGNPLTKELRKKLIMDVAQDIAKRDIIKAKP